MPKLYLPYGNVITTTQKKKRSFLSVVLQTECDANAFRDVKRSCVCVCCVCVADWEACLFSDGLTDSQCTSAVARTQPTPVYQLTVKDLLLSNIGEPVSTDRTQTDTMLCMWLNSPAVTFSVTHTAECDIHTDANDNQIERESSGDVRFHTGKQEMWRNLGKNIWQRKRETQWLENLASYKT